MGYSLKALAPSLCRLTRTPMRWPAFVPRAKAIADRRRVLQLLAVDALVVEDDIGAELLELDGGEAEADPREPGGAGDAVRERCIVLSTCGQGDRAPREGGSSPTCHGPAAVPSPSLLQAMHGHPLHVEFVLHDAGDERAADRPGREVVGHLQRRQKLSFAVENEPLPASPQPPRAEPRGVFFRLVALRPEPASVVDEELGDGGDPLRDRDLLEDVGAAPLPEHAGERAPGAKRISDIRSGKSSEP